MNESGGSVRGASDGVVLAVVDCGDDTNDGVDDNGNRAADCPPDKFLLLRRFGVGGGEGVTARLPRLLAAACAPPMRLLLSRPNAASIRARADPALDSPAEAQPLEGPITFGRKGLSSSSSVLSAPNADTGCCISDCGNNFGKSGSGVMPRRPPALLPFASSRSLLFMIPLQGERVHNKINRNIVFLIVEAACAAATLLHPNTFLLLKGTRNFRVARTAAVHGAVLLPPANIFTMPMLRARTNL